MNKVERLDRVYFKCLACENEFFIETVRLASGLKVICPNCSTAFKEEATIEIGRAIKKLYEIKPDYFCYWLE